MIRDIRTESNTITETSIRHQTTMIHIALEVMQKKLNPREEDTRDLIDDERIQFIVINT